MSVSFLDQKLSDGETIVLDGATGTELEKRGATMNDASWCALATRTHPDVLHQIHADYIRAGADIITANTYASTLAMLEAAGEAEAFDELNRDAIRIARKARDEIADRPVAIAGSISVSRAIEPGTDRIVTPDNISEKYWRAKFSAKADILASEGVDLIMMEMMRDLDMSAWATEEAVKTGLPVWVGIACEKDKDGRLVGFGRHDVELKQIIDGLGGLGGQVMGLMHSTIDDTRDALPVFLDNWDGPLAVYPESGHFEMPSWQFSDVIEPSVFARLTADWVKTGVQIVGGCCGIGPEHIIEMVAQLPDRVH